METTGSCVERSADTVQLGWHKHAPHFRAAPQLSLQLNLALRPLVGLAPDPPGRPSLRLGG